MVDIHSHILPGIDDGSASIEQSLEMAALAVSGGTGRMIATPHCNVPDKYDNYYTVDLIGVYNKFVSALSNCNIDLKMHLGMEVYATDDVDILLKQGKIISLNNNKSGYLLIEFPFDCDPLWVTYILEKVSKTGVIPIMAHPERYVYVQNYPKMVFDWVQSGTLMQINKSSLSGKFGEAPLATAQTLLAHALVHFAASDCHSHLYRTPHMAQEYHAVSQLVPGNCADTIFRYNPACILSGGEPRIPVPIPFDGDPTQGGPQ